ncbi:MAG TPA: tetratricopeptide repeat protein [Thermoflexia bacterium]|nr:tetratricopeptide repeat protein [Thermoflexia bacterium]
MSAEEIEQLRTAIAALEAQRATLGDAVVEAALAPLRERLLALTRAAPPSEERKRVTVLFSDLAGFTAMSEKMDPEDVTAVMDAYFQRMNPAILRYGGTIEKYIGDAILAIFGAPKALENHEEMAVRAALAMQEALESFNEELERERGFRLTMRIGVNTGLVMYGALEGRADRDFAIVGDTVNLASRLESACPPGRVMISAETARPLHALFDFEPPRQIRVKGKAEPITVYVVVGEKARRGPTRGVPGLQAPMVGREEELRTLQTAFHQLLTGERWQTVTVVGEAGVGKTRLRREFIAWVARTYPMARTLLGRCFAHTQNTPYALLADLLGGLFDLGADREGQTERLAAELQRLAPDVEGEELRYWLGSVSGVLGIPLDPDPMAGLDPEQRRDRTFLSLERILHAAARENPLLLVVEDLHWADALSLSFLEWLVNRAGRIWPTGGGCFLLALSRPEEEDSAYGRLLTCLSQPPGQRLLLRPLDAEASGTLVARLLDESDLPEDLLDLLLDRAQGNPFFLEEILRSLIEEGVLNRDPATGRWQVTRAVTQIQVPGTVQGVIAARLDRLPSLDKYVLQRAAIVGRTFWRGVLSKIEEGTETSAVVEALGRLESGGWVYRPGESTIADEEEWHFHHSLARDVAYESLPRRVRRPVHARVAEWLEQRAGSIPSFFSLIAHHYEQGNVLKKAVIYLRKAGEQAAGQFANADAIAYFSHALDLLPRVEADPTWLQEQRYHLLLGREGVYRLTGQREAQAADLEALTSLAREMGDLDRQAEVALRWAAYYEAISEFPAAVSAAQETVGLAEQAGDVRRKTEGLIAWGRALWRQGAFEEARERLEAALALAREHGDRAGEATCLHNIGTILYFLSDFDGAREQLEAALTIRRELGDRRGEAITLGNLAGVYHALGDFSRCKALGEQVLSVYRTLGDRRNEVQALSNLGSVHHSLGHLETARDLYQQAMDLFREIDDRRGIALTAENLGLVLHDLGDDAAARRYCEQALALEREIGDRQGEAYALTYLGLALEGLEEWGGAAEAHREAARIRAEIGQEGPAMYNRVGLARVEAKQGRIEEAVSLAEEALAWMEEHGPASIEYPLHVYLSAAEIFTAAGRQGKAREVVSAAHALLMEQAGRISDEDARRTFLEDVPVHRAIREWAARP